jgi:hypothetical protein
VGRSCHWMFQGKNLTSLWRCRIPRDCLGCPALGQAHNNKFEVLTAAIMNIAFSWNVTSCNLVCRYQHISKTLVPMYQNTWCQTQEVNILQVKRNRRTTSETTCLAFHMIFPQEKAVLSSTSNNRIKLKYKVWQTIFKNTADVSGLCNFYGVYSVSIHRPITWVWTSQTLKTRCTKLYIGKFLMFQQFC